MFFFLLQKKQNRVADFIPPTYIEWIEARLRSRFTLIAMWVFLKLEKQFFEKSKIFVETNAIIGNTGRPVDLHSSSPDSVSYLGSVPDYKGSVC